MTNLTQKKVMVSSAPEEIISLCIISFGGESSIWLFTMHMNVNLITVNQSENIQGIASKEDSKFASGLCAEDSRSIEEFQNVYCDEIYFIASKFNSRGISQDSWEYRTKTGYSIRVDDDVADTYLWLIKQAIRKSCSYGGKAGASFRTYITTILNSSFTFKDWLRWKTGDTGYIPKCIRTFSEIHAEIFLYVRRNLSKIQILERVSISEEKLLDVIEDIRSTLTSEGLIDLITNYSIVSIDDGQMDEDGQSIQRQFQDDSVFDPSTAPEFEDAISLIKSLMVELTAVERRILLLYWRENYTVDEIFKLSMINDGLGLFDSLQFKSSSEIYPYLTKLIKRMLEIARDKHSGVTQEYGLDKSKMKSLVKVYLTEFELKDTE